MRMKLSVALLAVAPLLVGQAAFAQAADDFKPASTNTPGQEYPKISSDLRAIFRVNAPDAQKVQVAVGKNFDMSRDTSGFWMVTTPPLVPGFHYYSIIIDGATVNDPNSETFFGVSKMMSGIEVPAPDQEFFERKLLPLEQREDLCRTGAVGRPKWLPDALCVLGVSA